MFEPPLPVQPNQGLVQRYTEREAGLELTHPTGDPYAFYCGVVRGGQVCDRRRIQVGKPGNKVLACPSCDQPESGTTVPDWSCAQA